MDLIVAFLSTFLGIPIFSLLVAGVQTIQSPRTPQLEASLDSIPATDIYLRHEAYNRYENFDYKEM